MIALPKLVLLILVGFAIWFAMRWTHGAPTRIVRRREAAPPRQAAIQDLVACRVCGAYAAADAAGCGKPDCPQPR
jgi:hypothetical protein